jgi:hypothetical protein
MEIGQMVSKMWSTGDANRSEWLQRQQEFLVDIDDHMALSTADGAFQTTSSLHIPVTLTAVKTLHARFLQALFGQTPPFTTKSRTEASMDRASLAQDVMAYSLLEWANEYQGVEPEVDKFIWNWVATGCGLLKQRWECLYEKFIDVVKTPELGPPKVTVNPQTGEEVTQPTVRLVEKEQEIVKKTFEGAVLEYRDNEDILIIGGKGDPQKADSVHDKQWLTASQLWTLVDRKIFNEDAVREIIESGGDTVSGSESSAIKDQRNINAGKSMLDTEHDLDRYCISESYLALDVDGSGINTQVVVWVHLKSKKLLHANYLRRMNRSGERPIFKADFLIRPGQDYGVGVCELLHPLAVEMDAMHNIRIDYGMFATMPFFFYRPTSNMNEEIMQVEPGMGIPLDNPQSDVYFPQIGNRTAFGFQEEEALQRMVDKLLSVNDITYGNMNSTQGIARTATGVRGLLNESNANLDVFLRRLQRPWKQVLRHHMHLLQQRIPEGLSFRVTGESGQDYWRYVKDATDLVGDFDFSISPTTADSNPAIQEQQAQEILQMVMNPLAIQTSIVQPGNIFEAYKNWYKAKGVKDYGRFISKPPEWAVSLSPQEEADRLLRGIDVPVLPNMDHQGYIAYFQEIFNSDELLGQFDEQQTVILAKQAKKHEQMMSALQEASNQARNRQQMQTNSAEGGMQAPPASNPMTGNQGGFNG